MFLVFLGYRRKTFITFIQRKNNDVRTQETRWERMEEGFRAQVEFRKEGHLLLKLKVQCCKNR